MVHRTPAARRYGRRMAVITTVYVALIVANAAASRIFDPPRAALAIMAVVTALPIVAMIGAIGLYLRDETDEFVRQRIVTAMLIGLGILFSVTSVLGFLQFEHIVGELPVFLAFPLWCAAWGMTHAVLSQRDRRLDARS